MREEKNRKYTQPIILENGAIYSGQILKDTHIKDGIGMMFFPNNSLYEGCWKNGQAFGEGRLIYANGDIYEGEWKNDQANGFGKFEH